MNASATYHELKRLIHRLKRGEKKNLRSFLIAFDPHSYLGPNKSLEAVELILENPEVDKEELAKKLNLSSDVYNLNKFFQRLLDKVIESLNLAVNSTRKGAYSEWYANKLEVRRKLTAAQTIRGRGMDVLANTIYQEIIAKSSKYELYEEKLEALRMLEHNIAFQHGLKAFDKLQSEIVEASYCVESVWAAREWSIRHFADSDRKAGKNEKISLLVQALTDLEQRYSRTKSDNVNYHIHDLLMEFYLAIDDLDKVRQVGEKLLNLVRNSPSTYNKFRIGSIYIDIADNEIYRCNYSEAYSFAEYGTNCHPKGGYNYVTCSMVWLMAAFYQNDEQKCLSLINSLLAGFDIKDFTFEYAKIHYVKAALKFSSGQYKEALRIVETTCNELYSDKTGWNIGLRIFTIQCCIEMGKFDLALQRLEAMDKHMSKLKTNEEISTRDKYIIRVLKKLANTGFDFQKAQPQAAYTISKLQLDDDECKWKPKTAELIRFEIWFNCRVKNMPYVFVAPGIVRPKYELIDEKTLKTVRHAEDIVF